MPSPLQLAPDTLALERKAKQDTMMSVFAPPDTCQWRINIALCLSSAYIYLASSAMLQAQLTTSMTPALRMSQVVRSASYICFSQIYL